MDQNNSSILIDPQVDLSPVDVAAVANGDSTVQISEPTRRTAVRCRRFLTEQVDKRVPIYGITIGYGPLANHFLSPALSTEVQRNLIYHLASGVGNPFSFKLARATLLLRLKTLSFGHSGVRPELLDHIATILNAGLAPYIPEMGTVGASGDLTPLSHAALALMGEGAFIDKDGNSEDASVVLRRHNISRLQLAEKEGLGMVNGTSAMTAIAALNDVEAHARFLDALNISLAVAEVFGSETMGWSERVGRVRAHPGQRHVHKLLSNWCKSSCHLRTEGSLHTFHTLPNGDTIDVLPVAAQSPYSVRCIPQLYGALLEHLWEHNRVVRQEICSVTDNPLLFPEDNLVTHAGNFFGQHVAMASDCLNMVISSIATHLDRCLARMTDPKTNEGLPAFLTGSKPGLHSGFMGAQVTVTALTAEIRSNVIPVSTQSLPTNGNNQDVVPLGTIAARRVRNQLSLLGRVEATVALAVAQAMDLKTRSKPVSGYSMRSQKLYKSIRSVSEFLSEDRPLSKDIERVAAMEFWKGEESYDMLCRNDTEEPDAIDGTKQHAGTPIEPE